MAKLTSDLTLTFTVDDGKWTDVRAEWTSDGKRFHRAVRIRSWHKLNGPWGASALLRAVEVELESWLPF